MRVTLSRKRHPKYHLGTLTVVNGYPAETLLFQCHTLELPWNNNLPNESCVPDGTYPLVLEYSEKFKRYLWELYEVPDRAECKIHVANFIHELNGCIAPGMQVGDINADGLPDMVGSRIALDSFHRATGARKYLTIEIRTE